VLYLASYTINRCIGNDERQAGHESQFGAGLRLASTKASDFC
jgi:hypothetical protein